jgi:hypothetical protein
MSTAGGSVSPATDPMRAGRFDPGVRRASKRHGREKGCWVYIPAEQLVAAGITVEGQPPLYRTWPAPGRPRVIVNLYQVQP